MKLKKLMFSLLIILATLLFSCEEDLDCSDCIQESIGAGGSSDHKKGEDNSKESDKDNESGGSGRAHGGN